MKRILFAFLLVIATFCTVNAQGFWITSVVPNPSMPTNCTPTTADISGNLPGTNYSVSSSNHSVVGLSITINLFITQSGFGSPVITPFTYAEPVGTLPQAGTFNVTTNYYLNGNLQETNNTTFGVTACCNVNAAFSTNNDTLCVGDTLLLTNSSTNATSFNWRNNGGNFANTPSAALLPTALGPLAIELIASDSSCSDTSSKIVEVIDCCTDISGFTLSDTAICLSDSTVLGLSTSTGADSLIWMLDTAVLGTAPNQTFTFSAPGTYQVALVTYSGFACSDTAFGVVTVSADPSANFSATTSGLCAQFTDASVNANSWTWDFGDGNSDSAASPQHCFAAPGTYTVCLVTENGMCTDTLCQQVTVDTLTGLPDDAAGFRLFPNPAATYTDLTTDGPLEVNIELFDTAGRLVLRAAPGSITRTRLHLERLPEGLYLLRIRTEDGLAHRRLLIRR